MTPIDVTDSTYPRSNFASNQRRRKTWTEGDKVHRLIRDIQKDQT